MNRWLQAGAKVNLWIAVLIVGLLLLGAGIGEGVIELGRRLLSNSFVDDVTLRFLGKGAQAAVIFGVGMVLVALAAWQLRRGSLGLTLSIVERQSPSHVLVTRQAGRGLPNAVLLSGHMGLLIVLKALQDSVGRTVAVTPPGSDFRSIARLLRTSYPETRVLSATAENAQLCAELTNGETVVGAADLEDSLDAPIRNLYLTSNGSTPTGSASWPVNRDLQGPIASADLIVFGPGSFYTSVIPSLLVSGIREAIAATRAATVYICNVMTEPGRTDGWTVTDFIGHFTEYAGFAPRYTIVNRSYPGSNILSRYEVTGSYPVMVTPEEHIDASKVILGGRFPGSTTLNIGGSTVIEADIIEVANESRLTFDPQGGTASEQTVSVIRHDPEKLTRALRNIIGQTRSQALAG